MTERRLMTPPFGKLTVPSSGLYLRKDGRHTDTAPFSLIYVYPFHIIDTDLFSHESIYKYAKLYGSFTCRCYPFFIYMFMVFQTARLYKRQLR